MRFHGKARKVTAKFAKTCDHCGGVIPKGSNYQKWNSKEEQPRDAKWTGHHAHSECEPLYRAAHHIPVDRVQNSTHRLVTMLRVLGVLATGISMGRTRIAVEAKRARATVLFTVAEMHEARLIHISAWGRNKSMHFPMFCIGDEEDAPKPKRMSKREIDRRHRMKARPSTMQAMAGPFFAGLVITGSRATRDMKETRQEETA